MKTFLDLSDTNAGIGDHADRLSPPLSDGISIVSDYPDDVSPDATTELVLPSNKLSPHDSRQSDLQRRRHHLGPLRAADPANPTRRDTASAATVSLVMIGALLLAALLNADVMYREASASELGPKRDIALGFWGPLQDIANDTKFSAPRRSLDTALGRPAPPSEPSPLSPPDFAAGPASQRTTRTTETPPLGPTEIPDTSSPPMTLGSRAVSPPTPTGGAPRAKNAVPRSGAQPSTSQPSTATSAPQTSDPANTTTTQPTGRIPTASDPLRVLVIGDSTMDGVGASVLRELGESGAATAELDYRISTGLARPDYFDWPSHLAALTAELDTEVVVLMLGANDAQPFLVDDEPTAYGTDLWFSTYRERVHDLLQQLTDANMQVVWIGQSVMRDQEYNTKMTTLNQIFQEEIAAFPASVVFLDSRPVMSDTDGNYTTYLVDDGGQRQQVRRNDGVHFTPEGGDVLAPLIVEAIRDLVPLPKPEDR